MRYYLVTLKMEFCHLHNSETYYNRKGEALDARELEIFDKSFENGKIWKLRIEAIPIAFFAKHKLFFICNLMLKLKDILHITIVS